MAVILSSAPLDGVPTEQQIASCAAAGIAPPPIGSQGFHRFGWDVWDHGKYGEEGARRWRFRGDSLVAHIVYKTGYSQHEKKTMYGAWLEFAV